MFAELAAGMFSGAAVYVNFVEQPARLSCGVEPAVTECRPSYKAKYAHPALERQSICAGGDPADQEALRKEGSRLKNVRNWNSLTGAGSMRLAVF